MTTPGGVPNLPVGALTLETLASKLQDMSGTAMKSRAVERFPSIFSASTGLNPALDITPFGILTRIWAEVNSLVANADPADIQGPEDLPPLVLEFIEGLPVVGQYVELLEAILGNYTGEDATLLAVQALFAPIRAIVDVITAAAGGDLAGFFDLGGATSILTAIGKRLEEIVKGTGSASASSFPRKFPHKFGATTAAGSPEVLAFFAFLRWFTTFDFNDSLGSLDDKVKAFIEQRLKPQNLLAWMIPNGSGGFAIPSELTPQVVLDFFHQMMSIVNTGAISNAPGIGNIGELFSGAVTAFLGLFGISTHAQSAATAAVASTVVSDSAASAASVPAGVGKSVSDTLDRGADTGFGMNYTQRYLGGGSALWGTDGLGHTKWYDLSAVPRMGILRENAQLGTNIQVVKAVLETGLVNAVGTAPSFSLCGRMNAGQNTYVEARCSGDGTLQIGYVVSDVWFPLDMTPIEALPATSEAWELYLGTSVNVREFIVKRQGLTILTATDSSGSSMVGVDYLHPGWIERTGVTNSTEAVEPPRFTTLSAADRVAA